jgi:cardiolipin synthase
MIAFPLFLASTSTVAWADRADVVAWLIGVPGLVLSWWAAISYLPVAREALAQARTGHGSEIDGPGVRSIP